MTGIKTLHEVQQIFQSKGEKRSVLLYANSLPRVATYLPLARALELAGYVCVLVAPADAPLDIGDEDLNLAHISAGSISSLKDVDVFISAEVVSNVGPRNAKRVALWHSLPDNGKGRKYAEAFSTMPWLIKAIDYMVIAARQDAESWTEETYSKVISGIYPAPLLQGRPQNIFIIPGGYPKLDQLQQAAAPIDQPDCILYCPTQTNQTQSCVLEYGDQIIAQLLNDFPEHHIVFRPYPSGDRAVLTELIAPFQSHPRFIFDTTTTGEEYAIRAAMTVTDESSASVTFSLATLRPSVFFRPDRISENQQFEPIGVYAHTLDELREATTSCIANAAFWREHIRQRRGDYVYNPGTSIDYLVDALPDIISGKKREDWLCISRQPWSGTTQEDKQAHLKFLWGKTGQGKRKHPLRAYAEIEKALQRDEP